MVSSCCWNCKICINANTFARYTAIGADDIIKGINFRAMENAIFPVMNRVSGKIQTTSIRFAESGLALI